MSRSGLTATYVTGSATTIRPIYCVYMDFFSGSVRVCNALNPLTITDDFSGGTYSAIGQFGTLSNITETSDLAAKKLDLTLSGIPPDYVGLALNDNYRGRTVCVYLLLFNSTYTAYEQTVIFRGRMDVMTIADAGDTCTITVSCESRLAEFGRARERRYTDEEQSRLYPGDLGLQYLASSANKDIWWGNASPAGSTIASGAATNPAGAGGGAGSGGGAAGGLVGDSGQLPPGSVAVLN